MTTRNKMLLSCLSIYLILDIYQAAGVSIPYLRMFNASHGKLIPNSQEAWNIFYSMQLAGPENKTWMYFLSLVLIPTIFSWAFIYIKNNYMKNMVITRKDYFRIVFETVKSIIFKIIVLKIIIICVDLLTISIVFHPVNFSISETFSNTDLSYILFSKNILFDFILYALFSIIGWCVWCVLFYSIFLFVNKTILILPVALLLDTFLIIVPAMVGVKNPILKLLMYLPFIGNLQSPGNITIGGNTPPMSLTTSCLFSILFYLVIIWFLFRTHIRKAQKGQYSR